MRAILGATLKEAVRKKTFIVMSIVSFLYLVLWSILLYYFQRATISEGSQFSEIGAQMITQMGLQFASMLLSLLTIMLGAGCISSELETGMAHAVLSRPLRRSEYVLGKYAGLFVLVVISGSILYGLLLAIGAIFSLSTVLAMGIGQILAGWLIFLSVPLCVLCVTLYGSVTIRTIPNGLLMIFIYILGNIGGMVEMIGGFIGNPSIVSAGIFISLISPFNVLFSTVNHILMPASGLTNQLMNGMGSLSGSGKAASAWMYLYIVVYAVSFIALAVRKFEKTDIA